MKIFVAILLIIITPGLSAQMKTSFHSRNYIGLLEGEVGTSWQIQTINGFRYRSWFTGLGTGLDFYRYRTVPLFLFINKNIDQKKNSFYLLSDIGINFAWINKQARGRFNDYISDTFNPSLYWNGGIGYSASLFKNGNALLISLAYSYKRLNEIKEIAVQCLTPPCPPATEEYNYYLKRISLRLGWEF